MLSRYSIDQVNTKLAVKFCHTPKTLVMNRWVINIYRNIKTYGCGKCRLSRKTASPLSGRMEIFEEYMCMTVGFYCGNTYLKTCTFILKNQRWGYFCTYVTKRKPTLYMTHEYNLSWLHLLTEDLSFTSCNVLSASGHKD